MCGAKVRGEYRTQVMTRESEAIESTYPNGHCLVSIQINHRSTRVQA